MVKRVGNPTGRNAYGEKGEGRNARIALSLYEEDKAKLDRIAAQQGISTLELIRRSLVESYNLERERQALEAANK